MFLYLFKNAVIPLTLSGQWRGIADVIAVGFYLAGVIPLLGIALLELGVIGRQRTVESKMFLHAVFVGLFLATSHIAMIFGMLNPELLMSSHFTKPAWSHKLLTGLFYNRFFLSPYVLK